MQTVTDPKFPASVARPLAEDVVRELTKGGYPCTWAEVGGSLRRGKAEVGDAEVVAELARELRLRRDIFGNEQMTGPLEAQQFLDTTLKRLGIVRAPPIPRDDGGVLRRPWSDRYRCGVFPNGMQLDLFIVFPPASREVVRLIRCGSADFSHAFVTRLRQYGLRSEQGRLIGPDGEVATPTEEAMFAACHLPLIPPEKRDMDIPETLALFAGP